MYQGTGILKSDCKQPLRIGIIRALCLLFSIFSLVFFQDSVVNLCLLVPFFFFFQSLTQV